MTNTNTNTSEQPTIKWETKNCWPDRIMPVKVLRESDKSLWIVRTNGIEQCRKGNVYHDTWEAAHNELLKRANYEVERQKRQLNSARSVLGEVEKMKPPDEL